MLWIFTSMASYLHTVWWNILYYSDVIKGFKVNIKENENQGKHKITAFVS